MTTTVIILNLAMWLPALVVLIAAAARALRPGPHPPGEEGRADWRGPFGRHLDDRQSQRTAASMATATNSSAR
jgi:hypothetical protein